jgi:hypothetical protein
MGFPLQGVVTIPQQGAVSAQVFRLEHCGCFATFKRWLLAGRRRGEFHPVGGTCAPWAPAARKIDGGSEISSEVNSSGYVWSAVFF